MTMPKEPEFLYGLYCSKEAYHTLREYAEGLERDALRWRLGEQRGFPNKVKPVISGETAQKWTYVIDNVAYGFESAGDAIDAAMKKGAERE